MRGKVAGERTIGTFRAIKRRLNRDHTMLRIKPLFFSGCYMVLNVLAQTMPGNAARKIERCNRLQKKEFWRSKGGDWTDVAKDVRWSSTKSLGWGMSADEPASTRSDILRPPPLARLARC
jgi:hypothetical protein